MNLFLKSALVSRHFHNRLFIYVFIYLFSSFDRSL